MVSGASAFILIDRSRFRPDETPGPPSRRAGRSFRPQTVIGTSSQTRRRAAGLPGRTLKKRARRSFAGSAAPNRRHFSRPGGRYKNCHLRCGHVHLLKSKKAAGRSPPHTRPAGPKRRPSSRRIRGDNRLLLFPCCSQPFVFVRETGVRTVARP